MESLLDQPVEITTDLRGSTGAQFISVTQDTNTLTRTVTCHQKSVTEIAQVKLYGDWQLEINFTYKLPGQTKDQAKQIAQYVKLYNSDKLRCAFGEELDERSESIRQAREMFKCVDVESADLLAVGDTLG